MVEAAEGAGQDALVTTLTERCEALTFGAEDAGGYFPYGGSRAGADAAGRRDVILLSVRAITYLYDAMHVPPTP
uniref:Uncharacterized protein n=1 Tax=Setaria viridis TaxID=4556 RepID=A0A4U6TML4_SETVI|nr:hypothetical protein SEVIR_7G038405v2 [Setaria viridis]